MNTQKTLQITLSFHSLGTIYPYEQEFVASRWKLRRISLNVIGGEACAEGATYLLAGMEPTDHPMSRGKRGEASLRRPGSFGRSVR